MTFVLHDRLIREETKKDKNQRCSGESNLTYRSSLPESAAERRHPVHLNAGFALSKVHIVHSLAKLVRKEHRFVLTFLRQVSHCLSQVDLGRDVSTCQCAGECTSSVVH